MRFSDIIRFYSDDKVKEKIIASAKQHEVVARFNEKVGARPDVLVFNEDIVQLVNKGATSFHASLERWSNPMLLKDVNSKKELDEIRVGWDLILDIDTKQLEYAKICAQILCEALEFHSIHNYSLKFSGGTGFHIGIPYESFPEEINGKPTHVQFPEAARIIAEYLKQMVKETVAERLLEFEDIKQICKRTGKQFSDIVKDGMFDPYTVLEIDTIAISSRHLMRMPYSFNEKTWLVSVPITKEELPKFKKEMAEYQNVIPKLGFLDKFKKDEAKQLFIQSFDWTMREQASKELEEIKKEFELPKEAISPEFFPPCLKCLYEGLEDGRKRGLFILINFLRASGWSNEAIEEETKNWNKKNPSPLSEGYVKSQINWHNRLKDKYLPPGCKNENFYDDLNICKPDNFCQNKAIKNPVVYPYKKMKTVKKKKPKKEPKKEAKKEPKKDSEKKDLKT